MSTLREDFEAWRASRPYGGATARDEQCFHDGYQAATERAAKVVEQVGPKEGSLALVTAGFAAAIRSGGEAGS